MADLALPESRNNMQKEAKSNSHRESALQDEPEKGDTPFTLPIEHKGILERYTETSVFQMFSPLIFNMKIFGLYFVRHYPEKSSCSGAVSYCTKCPTRSQVYATVCLLLCWTNVIPYLLNFTFEDRFGTKVLYKILSVLATTFASVNATVLYIAFHRADWLPEFFIYWDGLHGDVSKDRIKYVRKRVLACVVLSWIILLASMAYSIYTLLLFPPGTDDMMSAFFPKDSPFKHILKCVQIVPTLLIYTAWLLPMFLMSGVFEGLYREFVKLNKDISSVIHDKTDLGSEISAIRLRHQNICTLVEKADRSLNLLLANSFLMHVVIICIMMYMAVSEEHVFGEGMRVFVASWIIWSTLYLGISSMGAALVNSQVSFIHYDHD